MLMQIIRFVVMVIWLKCLIMLIVVGSRKYNDVMFLQKIRRYILSNKKINKQCTKHGLVSIIDETIKHIVYECLINFICTIFCYNYNKGITKCNRCLMNLTILKIIDENDMIKNDMLYIKYLLDNYKNGNVNYINNKNGLTNIIDGDITINELELGYRKNLFRILCK